MSVLVPSHSEESIPNVPLCMRKTITVDGNVVSSKIYSVSTLIKNVDIAEFIKSYMATKVYNLFYTWIQEFLDP